MLGRATVAAVGRLLRVSACVVSSSSRRELPSLVRCRCHLQRRSRSFASQVAARSSNSSSDEYVTASSQRPQQQSASSSRLPAVSGSSAQESSDASPYSPPHSEREQLYDDDALSADDDAFSSNGSALRSASSPLSPPASFLSGPQSFVAPMLSSLLHFIQAQQRRAQTERPNGSAAAQTERQPLSAAGVSTSVSASAAASSASASATAVTATLSKLNMLDPAFTILFPVYPLPPAPPLNPAPPFPCPPPLSQRTAASYAAYLSTLSPRTRLHVHLLAAADADNRFRSWLYSQLVSRAGQEIETFDSWMRLVTGNRVKALQQRQLQEMRICLAVWQAQAGRTVRVKARQLVRQWEATQLLRQSLTQLTHHVQRRAQAEAEGRQQDAQAVQQAIRRQEENVHVYSLLWYRAAVRTAKEAKRRAEQLILKARRGEPFVPSARGPGSEERQLESRRVALLEELMEEQKGWWAQRHRQQEMQRQRVQQQSRRLSETEQASRLLQPIDTSQPPSSFTELLSFYVAPGSAQLKMELSRHRFWLRERGRREDEELWDRRGERSAADEDDSVQEDEAEDDVDEQAADDGTGDGVSWSGLQRKRRRRWLSFLQREQQLAADCLRLQLKQDDARRRCIRSKLRAALLPLPTLTAADIRAALKVLQPFLALLPPLPSLSPALPPSSFASQASELQAAASSTSPAQPPPPAIPLSPYSLPYVLSWCHGVRGVTEVRERLYADDEGSVVVELVGVRRDAAVWLYEELQAVVTERRLLSEERMMRVQRSGDEEEEGEEEVEREDEAGLHSGLQAARRSVSAALQRAQRAQLGWTLVDLGDAVLQTFSDDQLATLGAVGSTGGEGGLAVGRRSEIGEEEAQRRLAALPVSRLNLVSRA